MSRYLPLICLALTHTLVDAFAMLVEPLWPDLKKSLRLSEGELFLLLSVAAIAPNFSQIAFGYLGDRYGSRYLLWLGPAVAVVCLPCTGSAGSAAILGLLLLCGSVGVGAFHPEAAVAAGRLMPEQRTRSLSLFMFGGTLGLGLGPMLSGNLVKAFGPPALAWLAAPGLIAIAVIQFLSRRPSVPASVEPPQSAASLRAMWLNGGRLALVLLAVCALRVVPNAGMTKAIAFTLESRGYAANVIGNTQSIFLASGSLGMLLLASRFRHGWERRLMVWSPLAAVPLLAGLAIPDSPYWLIVALLIPAGVILTGSTPVMVSYAHQLFPNGAGMASALTMGLSWGLSGMLVARLTSYFDRMNRPALLFAAFVPCIVLSALGARLLPVVGGGGEEGETVRGGEGETKEIVGPIPVSGTSQTVPSESLPL